MTQTHRSARSAIAVLCSGSGTNLQAILDAKLPVRLVISDREGARALDRARRAGVEALFVDPKRHTSRQAYDRELVRLCRARGIRLVCLAGFMRILSPVFVRAFHHRILNIHPALLPAFPGAHSLRDALDWGAKVTGVTVHLVDEQVDHGPIVSQEAVPIRAGDTEARLLARVHRVEHHLYPQAIRLMLSGRVKVTGRRVTLR